MFRIQQCLVGAYITFFDEEDVVETYIIKWCKNPTRRPITFLRALSGIKLSDVLLDGELNLIIIGLEVSHGSLHRIGEC